MAQTKIKLEYGGSVFWLVFWLIVWFPLGVILLATHSGFFFNEKKFMISYDGSRFWLGFWTLVFFPVAALLALLNGFSVLVEDAVLPAPTTT